MAIWSSSPSVPTAVEATQGALFRLERWSEYWCLPLNLSKCEASFSVDPHQANLHPNLFLLGRRLRFNPTPTVLGVTFDRTLSFSKHGSSLKAKFSPRLKVLLYISASSWGPSKDSFSFLYKAFLLSLFTYISLSRIISRIHSRLFSDWRRTVSSKFFDTQVPSYSTEELVLPRHARCVLSRLRCNGHSLLLGSYLSRIGRIENPSCSACGHSSQVISHLILHRPATDFLRRSLSGDSLSLYDLWFRPWGVSRLLGLHGFPTCPHPSDEVG